MRIKQIKINNFGPFYGEHQLDFPSDENGVYIIHGDTGQGKTSLLRAILWGLYGKVIGHNDKEIPLTSLLNWSALAEYNLAFSVTIFFCLEGKECVLTRKTSSSAHIDKRYASGMECYLVKDGQPIADTPEKVRFEIEKILPFDVSRFFFFDGEMLVKYEELLDQDSRSMRIMRDSIEHILGIPYLKTARDDLYEVKKRMERDKAKLVKGLGGENYVDLAEDYQTLCEEIERKRDTIKNLQQQENSLGEEVAEKKREETRIKSIKENALRRREIDGEIQRLQLLFDAEKAKLKNLNSRLYKTVLSRIADGLIAKLQIKHDSLWKKYLRKQELISRKKELEQGIRKQKCELCGTILNQTKLGELESDLAGIRITIEELTEIPQPNMIYETSAKYLETMKLNLTKASEYREIDSKTVKIEYEIARQKALLKQVEQQLINVDEQEPFRLETQIQNGIQEIGRLQGEQSSLEKQLVDDLTLQSELDQRLAGINKEELTILSKRVDCVKYLLEIFEEAIQVYRDEKRKEVEKEATEIFRSLRLKKEFSKLSINENFGLSIVTKNGTILNKAEWRSAGEEQIVALSLIGALNKCAKTKAPIFMDAPFGKIDIPHGQRILSYLPDMAEQVAVFVTDREYRKEDAAYLKDKIVCEYDLKHESEEEGSSITKCLR
jgi:DNA sulfur modification protein DndD